MSSLTFLEAVRAVCQPKCRHCGKPSHEIYCSKQCREDYKADLRELVQREQAAGCDEP